MYKCGPLPTCMCILCNYTVLWSYWWRYWSQTCRLTWAKTCYLCNLYAFILRLPTVNGSMTLTKNFECMIFVNNDTCRTIFPFQTNTGFCHSVMWFCHHYHMILIIIVFMLISNPHVHQGWLFFFLTILVLCIEISIRK